MSARAFNTRVAASAALALLAWAGAATVAAAAVLPRVFIETDVSSRTPYVQAATRVTVRVYSARALYHPDLDLPASADALIRQIGNDDRSTVDRDGRSYDVLTRQYLVFPQHSGKLTLPGAQLTAQVLTSNGRPDPFRGTPGRGAVSPYGYGALSIAVEPLQLKGNAIALDVRPRPAGAVGSYWMPARQVTLTSTWQPQSLQAHVGDALTLDVTEQADGLTAEQLPDLTTLLAVPPGLKVYPEEPKLDNFSAGDSVVGRRQQSIALIADRPGQYTLPALHLKWWDTAHDAPQEIVLPPRTLAIGAAPAAPPASIARGLPGAGNVLGASASSDPWRWATVALLAAWLLTLAAWYVERRREPVSPRPAAPEGPSSPGASRARAAFLDACRRHDARAARRHLIAWSAAEWARSPPAGLNGLARRIGDEQIERLLRELDRACFAGGEWRGDALALAFARWPQHREASASGAPARTRKTPLAPLYPS
ncbi:MAG TPA: hypothetical protein VN730_09155 [Steroidobacteraceae bacterium]|nr:hypothetical protein [Steroidobacteraceae bacterium]